jgi:hypothetical protein
MPDQKTKELPNPLQETIRWCELNRPDIVDHMRRVQDNQALSFLVSLGFAAGRVYQAAPAHDEVLLLDKSPYH